MYRIRSIVNDACNLEMNHSYETREEALECIRGLTAGFRIVLGREPEDNITELTEDVTVHTFNIGGGRVFTFYEIREG